MQQSRNTRFLSKSSAHERIIDSERVQIVGDVASNTIPKYGCLDEGFGGCEGWHGEGVGIKIYFPPVKGAKCLQGRLWGVLKSAKTMKINVSRKRFVLLCRTPIKNIFLSSLPGGLLFGMIQKVAKKSRQRRSSVVIQITYLLQSNLTPRGSLWGCLCQWCFVRYLWNSQTCALPIKSNYPLTG